MLMPLDVEGLLKVSASDSESDIATSESSSLLSVGGGAAEGGRMDIGILVGCGGRPGSRVILEREIWIQDFET